ncbi:MAG: 4Fe-4S dicluster domain-containing protein [Anaerolineae bacterium]|nr:4Fe-4S dicluster domain-containing protein [Anaerolineae bacterium]
MEARILQQDKLGEWINALIARHEVIAPRDALAYGKIETADEFYLSDEKPARSLKTFFFPQRQALVAYRLSAEKVELQEPAPVVDPEGPARIVFGARPCDAAAFPILDQVFAWDDVIDAYFQPREKTIIISIACHKPCETCFCVSLGGSPAGIEGSDLLLTPMDHVYHVQIITEQGGELIRAFESFFDESDQRHNRERASLEDVWRDQVIKTVDVSDLEQVLDFDNPVWETLVQQCVDCGICTFMCPTCHCFDIQDEGDPDGGERVRLWDSCAFYDYTKAHAGQPRPTHHRRYRQRIMHKFQYYPKNFGKILCVGCGRCIKYCPVSIDLTQVLEMVKPSKS